MGYYQNSFTRSEHGKALRVEIEQAKARHSELVAQGAHLVTSTEAAQRLMVAAERKLRGLEDRFAKAFDAAEREDEKQ